MGSWRNALALGSVAVLLAGCGSEDEPPAREPEPQTIPSAQTQEAYEAFLNAEEYKLNGWISDVASPREESTGVSPHDRVRVWFNPKMVESFAAGNGVSYQAPGHFVDSMVVKELYDESDALVGRVSFWKVEEGKAAANWIYYCRGPAGRCYSSSPAFDTEPLYRKGEPQCGTCHGGLVYTTPP